MPRKYFLDADEVNAAVARAREYSASIGKPLNISRVALNLGLTTSELADLITKNAGSKDEEVVACVEILKRARQENRADLEDCLAQTGNTTGYMFLAKVNHGMIEKTASEVTLKGVRFSGEDDILD